MDRDPAKNVAWDKDWPAAIKSIAANGLSDEEIAALAEEYARSGVRFDFGTMPTADVASTGGPSSLSTLLTPLFLVQAGFFVPKLGVPGRPAGGVDALAQIPDYKICYEPHEIRQVVEACGYAHFISAGTFAPLDASTFGVRQALGAQAVPELVIASLLSKKLAVGINAVGLDVRIAPHGNFGQDFAAGKANAKRFVRVAQLLGIRALCILTDGTLPFQPFIGRGEALWAIEKILSGRADPWLAAHTAQCSNMVKQLANAALPTVLPVEQFRANVEAQRGDYAGFLEKVESVRSGHTYIFESESNGYVEYDLEAIRSMITHSNSGHESLSRFPDFVGVRLAVPPGQFVERGTVVMTARIDTETKEKIFQKLCQSVTMTSSPAMIIGDEIVE